MKNIEQLIKLHGALLLDNPKYYCEIAYTVQTQWMAWLCSAAPQCKSRKVLACGSGRSMDEACGAALDNYRENQEK